MSAFWEQRRKHDYQLAELVSGSERLGPSDTLRYPVAIQFRGPANVGAVHHHYHHSGCIDQPPAPSLVQVAEIAGPQPLPPTASMDASFLNELLECSVCLEQLDSTSRVLPCQHTFCKRCLQEIVQSKGELRCPECRTLVETKVDELPVNIFLVRLLEGIKNKTPRKCLPSAGVAGQAMFPEQLLVNSGGGGLCSVAGPSLPMLGGSLGPGFYSQPSHPICFAKAIYPYDSSNASDLSFQKGDLINLIKRIDVNWYQGELKGKIGFVPASYITVVSLGPLATVLAPGASALGHNSQQLIGPGQSALAKALYDFQITDKSSEEKECLTFTRGEIIYVLRRVDENWAEGRVGDRQGIFPISFVEMNVAAKQLIKMITCSGPSRVAPAPPPLSSSLSDQGGGAKTPSHTPNEALLTDFSMANENKRHSLSALNLTTALGQTLAIPTSSSGGNPEHRHSMEMLSDRELQSPLAPMPPAIPKLCQPSSIPTPVHNAGSQLSHNKLLEINATVRRHPRTKETDLTSSSSSSTSSSQTSSPASMFYIALYNYKPQKDDELELKKGEVYLVSEKCQDGWFKGSALKSGAQGVFPGNYVQHAGKSGQQAQQVQQALQAAATTAAAAAFAYQTGPGGAQQAAAAAALVQGFSNLCVSSPMRPRSNPQLPLSALYGTSQRSSEWPLSTSAGTFNGVQFNELVGSGAGLSCIGSGQMSIANGGGAVVGGMLKCGNQPGNPSQGGQTYRGMMSTAAGKQNWPGNTTGADAHTGSPPLSSASVCQQSPAQQTTQSAVIAQHMSLVKRLTRHKSKSPPPALGLGLVGSSSSSGGGAGGAAGLDDSPPVHVRSGSCPSSHSSHSSPAGPSGVSRNDGGGGVQSSTGGTTVPGPLHKKTASLDDALASPSQTPLTPLTPLGVSPPQQQQQSSGGVPTVPTSAASSQTVNGGGGGAAEQYRCIVPYPANSDYELELKVGDVVYVHKKRDDGWCKGTLQRTGRTGLFPASFVKQTTATITTTPASSATAVTALSEPLYTSGGGVATDYVLGQGHGGPVIDGAGMTGFGGICGLPPAPAMFQCGPVSGGMGHLPPPTHILNPPQ